MSSQTIITEQNLPTGEAAAKILRETSMDLLKYLRFDLGEVCTLKIKNILRITDLHCRKTCYLDTEDQEFLRQEIIKQAISKLDEL